MYRSTDRLRHWLNELRAGLDVLSRVKGLVVSPQFPCRLAVVSGGYRDLCLERYIGRDVRLRLMSGTEVKNERSCASATCGIFNEQTDKFTSSCVIKGTSLIA